MPKSHSKAKAPKSAKSQQVTVNWLFFDKSQPKKGSSFPIKIPRPLYDDESLAFRRLFTDVILENLELRVSRSTVMFWALKEPLLVKTADEAVLLGGISNLEESLELISFTESFADVLERDIDNKLIVHLVVTATIRHDEEHDVATELPEIDRYHRIISNPGKSPSQGAKSLEYVRNQAQSDQAIHDGRYPPNASFSTVAPPVQIFHPIFDVFMQRVNDSTVQPTSEELRKIQELMHLLSAIGQKEIDRNAAIRAILSEIFGVQVHQEANTDGTSADGVFVVVVNNIRITILIVELKRELGDGGSDPSTQAGLMMRRSWLQDNRKGVRNQCCCPTLMLAGGGPWLGVLGGVFTDKVIVQRLTPMMWLGHSSTEEDPRAYYTAQVFKALRQSLLELRSYYEGIGQAPDSSSEAHSRFYPYPTSFTDETGKTIHFEYVKMLEDNAACVTYLAKISDPVDCPDIAVKFVTRYSIEVHNFLAERNHAPRLRYCGPLSGESNLVYQEPAGSPLHVSPGMSLGPMRMIVMDYISECETPPADARQQLVAVLDKLHSAGYVFGDLRPQNILFDMEKNAKIIDFDWAGRYDMDIRDEGLSPDLQEKIDANKEQVGSSSNYVRYPLNLSRNIKWANLGIKSLQPIRPRHDWDMLDTQFPMFN